MCLVGYGECLVTNEKMTSSFILAENSDKSERVCTGGELMWKARVTGPYLLIVLCVMGKWLVGTDKRSVRR